MDTFGYLGQGFGVALSPYNLATALAGCDTVSMNSGAGIAELQTEQELRFSTGMGELDRVLGGGAVKGSLVLVGGAPGIGKSTLLRRIAAHLEEQGETVELIHCSSDPDSLDGVICGARKFSVVNAVPNISL